MRYIKISPIRMGAKAEACGKINGEEKDCSLEVNYGKYHVVLHMEENQIELLFLQCWLFLTGPMRYSMRKLTGWK